MAKKKRVRTKTAEDALINAGNRPAIATTDRLKTGSTILDLAISGNRMGGFAKGYYYWMVGASSSGKTFLMLTCLAEASINSNFDDYRFIYDNAEDGALMNMERYFGPKMAARLEAPRVIDGQPSYSDTIEEFYWNLDDALKSDRPCIYLLDSMDALGSKYADKKFNEAKTAGRKGTAAKGDYGDGKAKMNSTHLRGVIQRLRQTGSILLILSQSRDNVGGGMFDPAETHAGGRALKFYATVQLWSSVGAKIRRTVGSKKIQVGVHCRVNVAKNRITGKDRTVTFPIYYETGIDDIGGMVDWMCDFGEWSRDRNGNIDSGADVGAPGKLSREKLIAGIERHKQRKTLEALVAGAWVDFEKKLAVKRESKYG